MAVAGVGAEAAASHPVGLEALQTLPPQSLASKDGADGLVVGDDRMPPNPPLLSSGGGSGSCQGAVLTCLSPDQGGGCRLAPADDERDPRTVDSVSFHLDAMCSASSPLMGETPAPGGGGPHDGHMRASWAGFLPEAMAGVNKRGVLHDVIWDAG